MKVSTANGVCLAAAHLALALACGCASTNVNPPTPRANTAYLDFYSGSDPRLAWDVQRFDSVANRFKHVFSELDPIPDGMLRVALPPGGHRLRITFLNRVISQPAIFDVEAAAGLVTPIEVKLTATGTTSIRTEERRRGGANYGRYDRSTKAGSYETQIYRITAAAQPALPYQLKEEMPYHDREAAR